MRIFGSKRNEVTGEWRKLHNEEFKNMYCSPNTFRVNKSRRMRWAGFAANMGRGEACTGFWWGNLREREHWEDPGVDGRIIRRRIFRKWDVGNGQDRACSGQRQVERTCECGNELSGSIK
jgi:hypothetical protein